MKLYGRSILAASLLSAGLCANAYDITYDLGSYGEFVVGGSTLTQDEGVAEPVNSPGLTDVFSITNGDYTFTGWEVKPGTLADDITLKAIYSKEVTIGVGKQLVSFNLATNENIADVFSSILSDEASYIKSEDGVFSRKVDGDVVNNIGTLSSGEGLLVDSAVGGPITIKGTSVDLTGSFPLDEGYAFIPFLFDSSMKYESYFGSILSSIESINGFDNSGGEVAVTVGTDLEAGKAYMVKLSEARTFRFPAVVPADSTQVEPVEGDGLPIIVTSSLDDATEDLTGKTWSELVVNGITLREAIYFAGTLAEGVAETITFDPSVNTVYLEGQLDINVPGAEFIIDGNIDDDTDRVADVTVTRLDTGVESRFLKLDEGKVYIEGLIIDNFSLSENGACIIVNGDNGTGGQDAPADQAILDISYSVISNNTFGNKSLVQLNNWSSGVTFSWTSFLDNTGTTGPIVSVGATDVVTTNCFYKGNITENMFLISWGNQNHINSTIINTTADNVDIFKITSGYLVGATNKDGIPVDATANRCTARHMTYVGPYTLLLETPDGDTPRDFGDINESFTDVVDTDPETYSKINDVNFIETLEEEINGAYAGHKYYDSDVAPATSANTVVDIVKDSEPLFIFDTEFSDLEDDAAGRDLLYLMTEAPGVSINPTSGEITVTKSAYEVEESVNVTVTVVDSRGKSVDVLFTFSFIADFEIPDPQAQPTGTETLIVTVVNDHMSDTALAALDASPAGITSAWTAIVEDGITLREAIWLANNPFAGGPIDTITFHPELKDSDGKLTVKITDQIELYNYDGSGIATEATSFIIDGDLNDDKIEDVTITGDINGTNKTARFIDVVQGTVVIDGVIFTSFKEGVVGVNDKNKKLGGTQVTASVTLNYSTVTACSTVSYKYLFYAKNGDASITLNWCEIVDNTMAVNGPVSFINTDASMAINNSYLASTDAGDKIFRTTTRGVLNVNNTTIVNGDTPVFGIENAGDSVEADYITLVGAGAVSTGAGAVTSLTNNDTSSSAAEKVVDGVRFIAGSKADEGANGI